MKIERMLIEEDIRSLAEEIKRYQDTDYTCVSDDMIVMGAETLRLRTSSAQWDMVVLKRVANGTQVDIIGVAGGSGFFNISWGSERSFVKNMRTRLVLHCEERGIKYDYLTA